MKAYFGILTVGLLTWGSLSPAYFANQTVKSFPSVNGQHKIALTIDDGPTPEVTEAMLQVLKEHNVRATFFMLGKNARNHPELVKQVASEGHLIGNHTWDHQWLLEKDPATAPINPATGKPDMRKAKWDCRKDVNFAYNEIRRTHDELKQFIPRSQKRLYFRPPGGGWCSRDSQMMNADPELVDYVAPLYWTMGGSVAYANSNDPQSPLVDAGDEECWTSAKIPVEKCLEGYRASIKRHNGGVLLNHDVHMESVELLQILIPELKAQGYQFVTLDEVTDLDALQGPPKVSTNPQVPAAKPLAPKPVAPKAIAPKVLDTKALNAKPAAPKSAAIPRPKNWFQQIFR